MSIWRPDPTFYPSPKMAMDAPAEKLAYVVMVNGKNNGRHDALGVVDVDPASSGYGHIVGQVDMPNAGDELHHFGWNACSACLCPPLRIPMWSAATWWCRASSLRASISSILSRIRARKLTHPHPQLPT
jgi:hypothetical protein